jgi:GR25 family glycosyltransferase involved in LPS biosynthesis
MKGFVINLKRRPDRLSLFNKTFEKTVITVVVVPAVDSLELNITSGLRKRINPWNLKYLPEQKMKNVVSCCLSHLKVWDIISKLDEPAFVFEDDCTFINETAKEYLLKVKLPEDFDIIWFNGTVKDIPGTVTGTNYTFEEFSSDSTTEGYLITPKFAKELIQGIQCDLGAADAHMKTFIKNNGKKSFKIVPPIFCQINRNDTDIQK